MKKLGVLETVVASLAAAVLGVASVLVATSAAAAAPIVSTDFEDGTLGGWEQSGGGATTLSIIDFDGGKVLQVADRDQDYVGVQTAAGALGVAGARRDVHLHDAGAARGWGGRHRGSPLRDEARLRLDRQHHHERGRLDDGLGGVHGRARYGHLDACRSTSARAANRAPTPTSWMTSRSTARPRTPSSRS